MARQSPLTLAFLEQKPRAAGRTLARMHANEAAALLDAVPTRSAVPALAAMGAWSAAAVLTKMNTESAAAALRALDYRDAAAILRVVYGADRPRLLNGLPEKLKADFEMSLAFPDGTAGAAMTTAVLTLTDNHNAGDAIDLLRRSASAGAEAIFVVDAERKLVGAASAASLIRHPRDTPLRDIADRSIEAVSARATLSSLKDLPARSDYKDLPVVSRQGQVIGSLSRRSILEEGARGPATGAAGRPSLAGLMLDAYLASLLGLAPLLAGGAASAAREGREP